MLNFPKIVSAKQTRATDAYTIQHEPITSIDLMERAAKAFVNEFISSVATHKTIGVICGTGNNGGDGLAISRLLMGKGYSVTPILIAYSTKLSPDCELNLNLINRVDSISPTDKIPDFSKFDILIDALLGSGLSRPVEGFMASIIKAMNQAKRKIYSIDIPSGLFCDEILVNPIAVQADFVISFQRPKLAFFFPEYGEFIKNWKVVPIGLDEHFIQRQDTKFHLVDESITALIRPRKRYSHKGTYGHSLIIAGSHGKMGAAILASRACLRSGTGLLTTYVPDCGYEIIQSAVPEAMCIVYENLNCISKIPEISNYDSIGIGPGLGTNSMTIKAFRKLLAKSEKPLVIDADGLNILAKHPELLSEIPKLSILTPHIKEFDRMFGPSNNSLERYGKQLEISKKLNVIIVLKDAHTAISCPSDKIFYTFTGNPGMATGGSGDVLTGIITGLLAQKYPSLEAALIAVFYHGLAGDQARNFRGEMGVIASDIINFLTIKNEKRH